MTGRYASATDVPSTRSREEIEFTVRRYGATNFLSGWDETRAVIGFTIQGRQVKFVLPLPNRNDPEFTQHSRGSRTPAAADAMYEQAVRQKWRALALVIKAKLVAVEDGVVTFDQEFGMHFVLPDGQTAAEHVVPWIAQAYADGRPPELLPPGRPAIEGGR